jgi:predicted MPP superfamily phosphohydrolase
MKILALGDTHGRSFWKLAVAQNPDVDKIIFIGDYFDSYDLSAVEQIANFKEIAEFKRQNLNKVVLLIGNHDHHYLPEVGDTGTSGYQHKVAPSITQVIQENRDILQLAYSFKDLLFTHAGVGESFLDWTYGADGWVMPTIAQQLNATFEFKPRAFIFNGRDSSGDDVGQTPIWIRPRSLVRDSQALKKAGIIQIVGHTTQKQIDIEGKATGGKYFFIDTLGTSGEYLLWEDGVFTTKTVK